MPAAGETPELSFAGKVECDRGDLLALEVPANELVVRRLIDAGLPVQPGDVLVEFDVPRGGTPPELLALDAAMAMAEEKRANLQAGAEEARTAAELAAARAELAEVRAALAQRAVIDPETVRLRRLEAAATDRAAARAATSAALARLVRRQGEASDEAVDAAELAAALAAQAAGRAQRALERAARPSDEARLLELRARERELAVLLALDAGDGAPPAGSLPARLAAQRERGAEQVRSNAEARLRREAELHESRRANADVTPLAWIAVAPAAGGATRSIAASAQGLRPFYPPTTLRLPTPSGRDGAPPEQARIAFLASGRSASGGAQADHGEAYAAARGYGWIAGGPVLSASAARVAGRAEWRLDLPAGRYRVELAFGDEVEWDGAVAALADGDGLAAVAACLPTTPAGRHERRSLEVDVRRGWLRVVLGDGRRKALRAPMAGVALLDDDVRPGQRAWKTQQLAWVGDPASFRVRCRIHQDLAALLAPPATAAAGAGADPRRALAASAVTVTGVAGGVLAGTVRQVGEVPVPLRDGPIDWGSRNVRSGADLLGREVLIALANPGCLRLGEVVQVRAALRLPPRAIALPSHLVAFPEDGPRIRPAGGAERPVAAVRAGRWAVVLDAAAAGLAPGAALLPPDPASTAASRGRWRGELVAGGRLQVVVGGGWGQLKDCVPDGTDVTAGQVVGELANSWLEQNRARRAREQQRARQDFQVAAEERRVRALQEAERRRRADLAVGAATAQLARTAEVDLDRQVDAEAAAEGAVLVAADAGRRLQRRSAPAASAPAAQLAEAGSAAALAALRERQARLELAAVRRAPDWLAIADRQLSLDDALAAFGRRSRELSESWAQDAAEATGAQQRLAQVLDGDRWERQFQQFRILRAPGAGRLFWLVGWDDQANRVAKIGKGFPVWGGLAVAEVLDLARLDFRCELPEELWPRLSTGLPAVVVLPQLGNRRLPAAIASLGRSLDEPRDQREDGSIASGRRVFTVTAALTLPADLAGRLLPGTKGWLELDRPGMETK